MEITLKFSPDEVRSIFTQVARDRLGIQSISSSEIKVLDYNDDDVDMDAIALTFEIPDTPVELFTLPTTQPFNYAEIPEDTTTVQEDSQTIRDCSGLHPAHAQILS